MKIYQIYHHHMNGSHNVYLQSNLFADLIVQQRIKDEAGVERDFYCPELTQPNIFYHYFHHHQIIINIKYCPELTQSNILSSLFLSSNQHHYHHDFYHIHDIHDKYLLS